MKYSLLVRVFLIFAADKIESQTLDTCGFKVAYPLYANDGFGVNNIKFVTARDLGDSYAFFIQSDQWSPAGNKIKRLNFNTEGALLSNASFMLPTAAIGISLDGKFLCAGAAPTGIRVRKLAGPGDTLWTGVFGIPGFMPKFITDFGADGIMVSGAESTIPGPFYPLGFLLKLDSMHQESWTTTQQTPGTQGHFYRTIQSNCGGSIAGRSK